VDLHDPADGVDHTRKVLTPKNARHQSRTTVSHATKPIRTGAANDRYGQILPFEGSARIEPLTTTGTPDAPLTAGL